MLEINFSKRALKFLKNLPPKQMKQLASRVQLLRVAPHAQDTKRLVGYENLYRADVGEYRIVYEVAEARKVKPEALFILLIGKRNDDEVYKKLSRLL